MIFPKKIIYTIDVSFQIVMQCVAKLITTKN